MAVKSKIKKKRWFKILASPQFHNREIGETYAEDPSTLVGRTVTVSMMSLTGEMKKQNINITFEIIEIRDEKAITQIRRYALTPSSIKRYVRKGRDRLDASFVCTTSDGREVKIKPFFLTVRTTGGTQQTALRKEAVKLIKETIKSIKYNDLFKEIIINKFQREVKNKLNKLYPLRSCEIRIIEEKKKKVYVAKKTQETHKVSEPKKPEGVLREPVVVAEAPKEEIKEAPKEEIREAPKKEEKKEVTEKVNSKE